MDDDEAQIDEVISPYERGNCIGHDDIEKNVRQQIDKNSFHHGWIITGASGIGKATLGARIARAVLSPQDLDDDFSLQMDKGKPIFRQVASFAHPDLFVARREFDEKKGKLENEISVDRIRQLTQFLSHTAAGGAARVAIIDCADDMNRNSANALLKILEEPPENTLLLLLANYPGRLLATIRSRCRMIDLRPVPTDDVHQFLIDETGCTAQEAHICAQAAGGRPGYAMGLYLEGGVTAIENVSAFISAAQKGNSFEKIIGDLTGKADEMRWNIFKDHLLSTLSLRARTIAVSDENNTNGNSSDDNSNDIKQDYSVNAYVKGWEVLSTLCAKGEGLNLDRASLIEAMGFDLASIFKKDLH